MHVTLTEFHGYGQGVWQLVCQTMDSVYPELCSALSISSCVAFPGSGFCRVVWKRAGNSCTHRLCYRGTVTQRTQFSVMGSEHVCPLLQREASSLQGCSYTSFKEKARTKAGIASVLASCRNGGWETWDIVFQALWNPVDNVPRRPLFILCSR